MDSNISKTSISNYLGRSLSLNFQTIIPSICKSKFKPINKSKKMKKKLFLTPQDFTLLKSMAHKKLVNKYIDDKDTYNIKVINDIISNESTHIVAEFKDFLITGDESEFLQKIYNINECKKYLPKIFDYYQSCSVIFPNYIVLPESKYIYKNIQRKQRVIDIQQDQEDKLIQIKKGEIKIDDDDQIFDTQAFHTILEQTNTSNIKKYFGIKNSVKDSNFTPNNILGLIENAEAEVNFIKKINLKKKNILLNNVLNLNYAVQNKKNLLNHFKNNNNLLNYNKKLQKNDKNENPKIKNNNLQIDTKIKNINNLDNLKESIKINPNEKEKESVFSTKNKKESTYGRNFRQHLCTQQTTKNDTSLGKFSKQTKFYAPVFPSKEIILKMITEFSKGKHHKGKNLASNIKNHKNKSRKQKSSFSLSPSMTTIKMSMSKSKNYFDAPKINDSTSTTNISKKNINKTKQENLYRSTIIGKEQNLNTLPITEREKNDINKLNKVNLNIYKINSGNNIQKPSVNKSIKYKKNTHVSSSTGTTTGSCGKTSGYVELESIKITSKKKGIYKKEKLSNDKLNNILNKDKAHSRQFSLSPNKPEDTLLNKNKLFSSSSIAYMNTKINKNNQKINNKNSVLPIRKDIQINIKNLYNLPLNIQTTCNNSSRNNNVNSLTERKYFNVDLLTNSNNHKKSYWKNKENTSSSIKSLKSSKKRKNLKKHEYIKTTANINKKYIIEK